VAKIIWSPTSIALSRSLGGSRAGWLAS